MIYLEHFGLSEPPFGITPDTSFFCSCRSIQEAFNTVVIGATHGEGFIKITGEVGTGKTLLCRKFLASLGPEWVTAYVPSPQSKPRALLLALAQELAHDDATRRAAACPPISKKPSRAASLPSSSRAPERHLDEQGLMRVIDGLLLGIARSGRRAVLCVDEAQALPIETLETVRLLTNLETEKRKLLQVVLFGQQELDAKLAQPRIRQLRSRITFEQRLSPLTPRETEHYLAHRMIVAGYGGAGAFSRAAARAIHSASAGIPRLVNILAHKSLLLAFGRGLHEATWREAHAAMRDTPAARSGWPLARLQHAIAAGVDLVRQGRIMSVRGAER